MYSKSTLLSLLILLIVALVGSHQCSGHNEHARVSMPNHALPSASVGEKQREDALLQWARSHATDWNAMSQPMQLCVAGEYITAGTAGATSPEEAIERCEAYFRRGSYSFME